MAEGFLRAYGGERFIAESAGTVAGGLHPLAVRVMTEIGIDISGHRSRSVDELTGAFDVCVTVCDANCPIPPRAGLQLRWQFADPAEATGTETERLAAFRLVRDGIGKRVRALIRLDGTPAALTEPTAPPLAGRTAGGRVMPHIDSKIDQGLPSRPGEVTPPGGEQGKQGGMPIDQPLQPAPQPKQEPAPTM
jgi:arsenate reductase